MSKLIIDTLETLTGWTATGDANILGLNEYDFVIAGYNDYSIMFDFSTPGDYVEKILVTPINVTEYTHLVFSGYIAGYVQESLTDFSQFQLKLAVNDTDEFLIPRYTTFTHILFDLDGVNEITKIRFTSEFAGTVNLVASNMLALYQELPLDIFEGLEEGIKKLVDERLKDKYLIGTITASTGDTSITFTESQDWLSRYAVIRIFDGVNTESHQLGNNNNLSYELTKLYAGTSITQAFTNANVYLYFPVVSGRRANLEIQLPSFTIWGLEPTRDIIYSDVETEYKSFKNDDTVIEQMTGQDVLHKILIDCEARQDELLADLVQVTRDFIGQQNVWVSGINFDVEPEGPPLENGPTEHFDVVPKIQYTINVKIREDIWPITRVPKTATTLLTTEIK